MIAGSLETPAAFGVIFDRHGSTLLRFLTRRVDPAEAEDLLGEVFRIAFERRSTFEQDRDSARPWLYGMEHPDRMLAWLEIGDGMVMIGRAGEEHHGLHSPLDVGALTAMVNVHVHDIDAHYRRAEAEGARIVMPLDEMFWGDRRYEALDPEGHRWHFAERVTRAPDQPGEFTGGGGS